MVETEQVFLVFARTYAGGGAFQGRGIAVRHQAIVIIETVRRGGGILPGEESVSGSCLRFLPVLFGLVYLGGMSSGGRYR
mgnify:CR=1 FL=1